LYFYFLTFLRNSIGIKLSVQSFIVTVMQSALQYSNK